VTRRHRSEASQGEHAAAAANHGSHSCPCLPFPDLSRERRQEFVKTAHRLAEEGRVHVRNVRRDVMEAVKKAKLPEDENKRLEKEIQAATDKNSATEPAWIMPSII